MLPDEVEEEIACLEAILTGEGDLDVVRHAGDTGPQSSSSTSVAAELRLKVAPLTAEDADSAFVGFVLVLTLGPGYPADRAPGIQIRNPRGLSEKQLDHLRVEMRRRCQELEGCPVAFELLDLGREYLTANNVPRASPCPICLEPFEGPSKSGTETSESSGTFCKTPCFHHFHKVCLGRYLRHLRADDLADKDNLADGRKIPCPVCRTDLGPGMASMDPGDDDDVNDEVERDEAVDEELKEQLARFRRERRRLDPVFQRQLRAGGIIDLEAEQPPVVVLSSAIGLGTRDSSQPSAGGTKCPPPPAPAPPPPSAAAATTTDDDPGEGPSSVRRGHHDRGQKPHRKNRPPRRGNSRR